MENRSRYLEMDFSGKFARTQHPALSALGACAAVVVMGVLLSLESWVTVATP